MLTYSYHYASYGFAFHWLFLLVRGIQRNDIRVDCIVLDFVNSVYYSHFTLSCDAIELVIAVTGQDHMQLQPLQF